MAGSVVRRRRLRVGLGAALAALSAAAAAETLTYTLAPDPEAGILRVELTWETAGREASRLALAERWGQAADPQGFLRDVAFEGLTDARREGPGWNLKHRPGAALRCRYVVDPGRREFGWDGLHLPITGANLFHGVGATCLLVPAPAYGAPDVYEVLLRWRLPGGWDAACSWALGRTVGARLAANDLRQSVYLAGRLATATVRVPGADDLSVVMPDEFGFSAAQFAEFAAGIIAAQCAFMQDREFPPFVVTAIPVGPRLEAGELHMSGTGLYRSFALFVQPGATLTEGVEHLLAHELFHHWNGGVLRPAEPEELVYWFTEGFTDYYALRILHESGRWTAEQYAKWVNRHIREYHANPARHASNEEIRAGFWRERDTVGEVPYQRGQLLALRWHRLARDRGVRDGLDRLMRALVERGRAGDFELSNDALRALGAEQLGAWFAGEFDRYVAQAELVEVPPDALAPDLVGRVEPTYTFELGFDRDASLRDRRVTGLVAGSAAAAAGLREGDELAGWSIHGEADRKVQLQVRRDERLVSISYYPRGARRDVFQFSPARSRPAGR